VQDVANHLVAMNLVFAALIDDGPMPERRGDHLGNDPVEAYWASAASFHAAFARPGVLERSVLGPMGSATGAERLQIRLYDLLAHGWDLMQATGIRAHIPEELAEQALVFVRDQLSTRARTGRFAEPQSVDGTPRPSTGSPGFLDGRSRRGCRTDRTNDGADRAHGFQAKPPPAANRDVSRRSPNYGELGRK
jgi:uncharacterized protein (TIGR03086 family)